jgi:hypothetical protein
LEHGGFKLCSLEQLMAINKFRTLNGVFPYKLADHPTSDSQIDTDSFERGGKFASLIVSFDNGVPSFVYNTDFDTETGDGDSDDHLKQWISLGRHRKIDAFCCASNDQDSLSIHLEGDSFNSVGCVDCELNE